MSEENSLDRLGELLGITPFYWEIRGERHDTSGETRRALIEAMGYCVATGTDIRESLDKIAAKRLRRLLAPVTVHRTGSPESKPSACVTHEASRTGPVSLQWTLECEGGRVENGASRLEDLALERVEEYGADRYSKRRLVLPGDIPLGYHRLRVKLGKDEAESTVIVAPPHAHHPEWLDRGERLWGVAHQLYSLRSAGNWGIGDLGDLKTLCGIVGEEGGSAVGLNPLHALIPSHPEQASPYFPSSRLFRNPLYLDVTAIAEFNTCEEVQNLTGSGLFRQTLKTARNEDLIDYSAVTALKMQAFERLFACFEAQHPQGCESARRSDFERYLRTGGEKLHRFALYQALREHFGGKPTAMWPDAYRRPDSVQTLSFAGEHESRVRLHAWLQWETDRQLSAAAQQCASSGMKIGLYNDFAVGVDAQGADAWADGRFYADAGFGCPPDPFAQEGQNWGMPPLIPESLREAAYRPFVDVLRANMRHAGALRIDHAMWLRQLFWIPNGGGVSNGAYVRYPMDDLFAVVALESTRARCLVIGEALGTVPEGFRERMEAENVLSCRLLCFERYPDGFHHRPSAYPRLALAMPASHDQPTLAGFWSECDVDVSMSLGHVGSDDEEKAIRLQRGRDREMLVAALKDQDLLRQDFPVGRDLDPGAMKALIRAVHCFLARTPSALMMMSLEDLSAMREQVNVPGTVDEQPNWRRRLPFALETMLETSALAETSSAVTRERISSSEA